MIKCYHTFQNSIRRGRSGRNNRPTPGTSDDEELQRRRDPEIYGVTGTIPLPVDHGSNKRGKGNVPNKSKKCGDENQSPTPQQAKKWQESIENLLNDPKGVQLFTKQLKDEYAVENMDFWKAVNNFKDSNPQGERLKKEARKIFNLYIAEDADTPINVNGRLKTTLKEAIEDPNTDMFDDAQKLVFQLMKDGAYKRFISEENLQNIMISGHG